MENVRCLLCRCHISALDIHLFDRSVAGTFISNWAVTVSAKTELAGDCGDHRSVRPDFIADADVCGSSSGCADGEIRRDKLRQRRRLVAFCDWRIPQALLRESKSVDVARYRCAEPARPR